MPSKILSFNRGLFVQNLRSVSWIGIVHFLLWFAAIPLQLLMAYSQKEDGGIYLEWESLYSISATFQAMIAFTLPVLLATLLFRYMQGKQSVDFMHSLPVQRAELFCQQTVFGVMLIVMPIALISLLTAVCHYGLSFPMSLTFGDIIRWTWETTVMELFVFAASIFVGMMTGMSTLQVVFTYILLLFPAGITILVLANISFLLVGFPFEYYLSDNLEKIIPFLRYINLEATSLTVGELLAYLLLTILFLIFAIWLYQKRPSEAATQALAFPVLRPIFKYGVTFCTMLLGGLYFGVTQNQFAWILFGYIAFSLLGFFIAEMIIEKTWRVFYKWKGYVYFAAAMIVIGVLIHFDVTGYEKRLPALENIRQVYFGSSVYDFVENHKRPYVPFEQENQFLKEKENIRAVYAFHQQLVKDQPKPSRFTEQRQVVIGYVLKDGKRMIRQYNVPSDLYFSYYKPILESKEYKKNYYLLLRDQGYSPIRQVTFHHPETGERTLTIIEPKQIDSFVEALKADLLEEPASAMFDSSKVWKGDIEFLQSDGDTFILSWKKTYTHVEKWLNDHQLLEKARGDAE
ncbi:ABC-2 type transport system permease protein [Parageobacillus thermantarcticus]|uniref:ABC-2 type transport system permease protein n=1 Tax=Parageobacillus thermantarcticus TaxID=186116 RepID=A0A1I0SVQ7_9BACL|nr:multidrug ABC transporter permease [Parageobacillus thermantarcticus]SFA43561.1 ABC-2 type transport system permease protein [Parageobacillus thermantarcticus]